MKFFGDELEAFALREYAGRRKIHGISSDQNPWSTDNIDNRPIFSYPWDMKKVLASILMVLSASTHAATFGIFRTDPIAIIIQGPDSDANRLYDSLNVIANEIASSLFEKKVESPSGQIAMSCRHSKLTSMASCTITVKRRPNLEISEEKKRAYLQSYDRSDTEFLHNQFFKDDSGRVPMFVTEKQEFAFSSEVERFILSYQQIGQ